MCDLRRYLEICSIQRWLRTQGAWVMKTAGGPLRDRLPDLLIVLNGRVIALKVLSPGCNVTPLQRAELDRLRSAGAVTGIVHSLEEVKAFFEPIRQDGKEATTDARLG